MLSPSGLSPIASTSAPHSRNASAPSAVARLPLAELRRLAGFVESGLLTLDDAGVAREEAGALERRAELWVDLDEGARDAVPHRTCLAGRAAAVQADAQVV